MAREETDSVRVTTCAPDAEQNAAQAEAFPPMTVANHSASPPFSGYTQTEPAMIARSKELITMPDPSHADSTHRS